MKPLRVLALVLTGVLVFLTGCWFFFPWKTAGEYMATKLQATAAESGNYVSGQLTGVSGWFVPVFAFAGVKYEQSAIQLQCSNLRVSLLPLSSLFSGKIVCGLEVDAGKLDLVTGQSASWASGRAQLAVSPAAMDLRRIDVMGNLGLQGNLTYQVAQKQIGQSDLTLKIPAELDETMTMLQRLMPLQKMASGQWKIERNVQPNP